MKKISKILIVLMLGVVMILGVAGCNTDMQNDLQSKIDELQAQVVQLQQTVNDYSGDSEDLQGKIDELQSQIEEMENRLAEMDEELRERDATIEDLNDQLRERDKRIEDLEKELRDDSSEEGAFYSLQAAYDYGYLTKTDLKDFCYYCFGAVWEGEDYNSENWTKIEYTPTRNLSSLDNNTETKIKELYYKLNEERFYSKNEGNIGGIDDLTIRFFGEFNNSYIVQIDCSLWDYGAIDWPTIVAGIAWWETGDGFKVFRID